MGFDRGCGRNSSGVGTLRVVFSFAFYSGCRVDQPNERVKPDQTRPDWLRQALLGGAKARGNTAVRLAWRFPLREPCQSEEEEAKRAAASLLRAQNRFGAAEQARSTE